MTSEMTSKGYLKGNARHWFWPAGGILLWMLIWTAASPSLYSTLLGRSGQASNMVLIAAGIQTFLHTAAWVMIGLAYGLTNRVKVFRIMFLIVAGVQVAGAYSHYLSNFAVSYILYARGPMSPAAAAYTQVMSLLLSATWIVFALIAVFHKRTGGGLRTAAIVLLAVRILGLVHRLGYETFVRRMLENMANQRAVTIIGLTGFSINVLIYGSLIFFFGAMAFSRMREADGTDA